MATKSKSKWLIAVWSVLFSIGLSGVFAVIEYAEYYWHPDYFHTPNFQSEIDSLVYYLDEYDTGALTEAEAKEFITVTAEDINEHRYRYGTLPEQIDNIKAQYESRIQGAKDSGNEDAEKAFIADRDKKIADITMNFQSDDHVKTKIVEEQEKEIEKYFEENSKSQEQLQFYKQSFLYYFKNQATGETYTNIKGELNRDDLPFSTNYSFKKSYYIYDQLPVYDKLPEPPYLEGYIAVPQTLSADHPFIQEAKQFQVNQKVLLVYGSAGIFALFLSLLIGKRSVRTAVISGKRRDLYFKLPIDVRYLLFAVTTGAVFISAAIWHSQIFHAVSSTYDAVEVVIYHILLAIMTGFMLMQYAALKAEWQDSAKIMDQLEKGLLVRTFAYLNRKWQAGKKLLKEAFLQQSFNVQIFILLLVIFLLGSGAFMLGMGPFGFVLYIILLAVIGLPIFMLFLKHIAYFNQIIVKASELASGKYGNDLPASKDTVLGSLAVNLNQLKQGVRKSQNEQAKSEHLKTELITNVSHDLRTPLTSIITYTELLKNGNLPEEDRDAYIQIIDRKSKRLKVLIDDLFEVSKMASGNIELKKERADLVQLLQQALGEYDDSIREANLQFRVTNSEEQLYALVDGQKIWRVFDNLIGNILKYTLPGTRVYVHTEKIDGIAIMTFKNISKYELGDQSDDLFERFKRGDTSRHTEGSGLGLAIAKSIMDLHDGSLQIETDGDLFKVIVKMECEADTGE